MAQTKTREAYDAHSIRVLKGLEPVKQRPGMYTLTDNPLHIIQEVLDNATDEVQNGFGSRIDVTVAADGAVTIEDDGRGIPTGIHEEEGISVLELVFTRLHAGGKFAKTDGSGPYSFAGGLHGVGVSVTNALSRKMVVTVWRDGEESTLTFADGFPQGPIEKRPSPRPKSRTGTRVTVWPDPKYFDSPEIPEAALVRLLRSKAVLLPDCEVRYKNEKRGEETVWRYDGGLKEYLLSELTGEAVAEPFEAKGFAEDEAEGFARGEGAEWVVVWTGDGALVRESYVNLIPTPQGGTHESGLKDGLFQAVKAFMEVHGLQTKGVKVLAEDVWSRANFILATRSLDPQFQGQTKEKLTSRDALKLVSSFVRAQFEFWLNDHVEEGKKLAELFLSQAQTRQRQAAKHAKKKAGTVTVLPGKLTECETDDITRNELFIVEGDSAGGSAKSGRDKDFRRFSRSAGRSSTPGTPTRTAFSRAKPWPTSPRRSGWIRIRSTATPTSRGFATARSAFSRTPTWTEATFRFCFSRSFSVTSRSSSSSVTCTWRCRPSTASTCRRAARRRSERSTASTTANATARSNSSKRKATTPKSSSSRASRVWAKWKPISWRRRLSRPRRVDCSPSGSDPSRTKTRAA